MAAFPAARAVAASALLASLPLAAALPVPPLPLHAWSAQGSGTVATLRAVAFADAQHGWAVGDGVVLGTSDGGAHWALQATPTMPMTAVLALGPAHAVALGVDRTLLETTDGATWTTRSPGGWMLDEQALLLASDGTWWMAGMASTLAPDLWRSPDAAQWIEETFLPDGNEGGFAALAEGQGVLLVAGHLWDGRGVALRSLDGGSSWQPAQGTWLGALTGVAMDGQLGFASGVAPAGGALYRTLDGGASWAPEALAPAAAPLYAVALDDPLHALAVGEGGALATSTGGTLWAPEAVPGAPTLLAVAFAPHAGPLGTGEAWAVGEGGAIAHRT